jgi:hypothetical protein
VLVALLGAQAGAADPADPHVEALEQLLRRWDVLAHALAPELWGILVAQHLPPQLFVAAGPRHQRVHVVGVVLGVAWEWKRVGVGGGFREGGGSF